jgi:glyoxylase-like metal-dependent hydrolase (beta-lactamase superfamily II)
MDSMIGISLPDTERWSSRVFVVRGLNPGLFTGPGTNTYVVGTGPRPLLLDTGVGRPEYIPLLQQSLKAECDTDELSEILLTHVHPDHIGGAADVRKAFGDLPVRKHPWPEKDAAFPVPIQPLQDGDVIETEGATLRALHTPGHALDHICFYLEEERALFTGDVILGAGTSIVPIEGGDMDLYMRTLERLAELNLDRIYPGHGPWIPEATKKVQEYLDHRRGREAQILRAIESGVCSVAQIVATSYTDTPKALHPAAAQSVQSHLVKLERDQRVARGSDAGGEDIWSLR